MNNCSTPPLCQQPEVVLLHGWSFDQRIWEPIRSALQQRIDRTITAYNLLGYDTDFSMPPEYPTHSLSPLASPSLVSQQTAYDKLTGLNITTAREPIKLGPSTSAETCSAGTCSTKTLSLENTATRVLGQLPDRCQVVGWSLGGLVALAMACLAPERIQQVILVCSTPCFMAKPGWPGLTRTALNRLTQQIRRHPRASLTQFYERYLTSDQLNTLPWVHDRLALADLPSYQQVLLAGLSMIGEQDLRPALAHCPIPITVLLGDNDPLVPAQTAAAIQTQYPHWNTALYSHYDHFPMLNQTDHLTQQLYVQLTQSETSGRGHPIHG